jgi:hypothetical protein
MRITIVLVKLDFLSCINLKKTATETFEMLKSGYDEGCLSRTSVSEWHKRFKEGQKSLQDNEQRGCPSTSRMKELTEVIQSVGRRSNFECLDVRRNDRDQLRESVTGDESWCSMYNPETKCQSATWLSPKKPKAQKVRIQQSWVKRMLTAFFDAKGIIHHDCTQ